METAERIELVFGMEASFHPSYTVLTANSAISKNKGTSLGNFFINSGISSELENVERSEGDKLDRRRSTELIIPPSSDAWPL